MIIRRHNTNKTNDDNNNNNSNCITISLSFQFTVCSTIQCKCSGMLCKCQVYLKILAGKRKKGDGSFHSFEMCASSNFELYEVETSSLLSLLYLSFTMLFTIL